MVRSNQSIELPSEGAFVDVYKSRAFDFETSGESLREGCAGIIFPETEETIGGTDPIKFLLPPRESTFIRSAWLKADAIENEELRKRSKRYLMSIWKSLNELSKETAIELLPSLSGNEYDDEFMIEWIFDHFRIGISIELDHNESSWYVISDEKHGRTNLSAYIHPFTPETLSKLIINFISFFIINS